MNIYLLEQEINDDYDTYDSVVVAAMSEEQAITIHPEKADWDGKAGGVYDSWVAKEDVRVTLIDTVNGNNKGSVLFIWRANAPKNSHTVTLVDRGYFYEV